MPTGNVTRLLMILITLCFVAAPFDLPAKGSKGSSEKAPSQNTEQPQQQIESQQDDPVVAITVPKSYYTRKVLLFPLELPSYVMQAITWPIGAGLKYAEKKNAVQKVLDFHSNKEKTFWVYPVIEGGAGSGFGGGIGLRHTDLFHKGYLLAATYRIHINMNQRAAVSFGKPSAFSIFDRPVSYSFGFNWQRSYQTSYYGMGNDSSKDDQSNFDLFDINTGVNMVFEPVEDFSVAPHIAYDSALAQNSDGDGIQPVGNIFPPAETAGLSTRQQYMDLGLRLAHDTRDRLDLPEKGGLRSFTYHHFFDLNGGGPGYDQFQLDISQYIRLLKARQVLVLHTSWQFQTSDGQIPFYRLSTLDVASPLRGFVTGRFRDNNYMLFNFEYRFPVWSLIDGVIFCDTGRVFHSMSDISLANMKYSAGAGLKIRIPDLAMFRFEAAYGGEGFNMIFGTSRPL